MPMPIQRADFQKAGRRKGFFSENDSSQILREASDSRHRLIEVAKVFIFSDLNPLLKSTH
jgi:hypothetical protein